MKLVRYGPPGKEKPGLIDAEGKLRDLSRKVKDFDATTLAPGALAQPRSGGEGWLEGVQRGHYGITWPNAASPSSKPRAAAASGT